MLELLELFGLLPPKDQRQRRYYWLGIACAAPLLVIGILFLVWGGRS